MVLVFFFFLPNLHGCLNITSVWLTILSFSLIKPQQLPWKSFKTLWSWSNVLSLSQLRAYIDRMAAVSLQDSLQDAIFIHKYKHIPETHFTSVLLCKSVTTGSLYVLPWGGEGNLLVLLCASHAYHGAGNIISTRQNE